MNNYKDKFNAVWMEVMENKPTKINSPSDCVPLLGDYRNAETEQFIVITLDGEHKVIETKVISSGILNRAIIHPREVFRSAITDNACSIVIAHNHPSGSLEPSKEDRDITFRLKEAGQLLGIEVLDHIIVSIKGYFSFLEEGEF
jgi:DNA repair protein RadC